MIKRPAKQHNRTTKQNGFTLIEALLTVAVLGLGLVLILTSFNAAANRNLSMQEYDNVCSLASKITEELNESPYITFSAGHNGYQADGEFPGYYTSLNTKEKILYSNKDYGTVSYFDITITVTTPAYKRYTFKTCKMVRQ